MSDEECKDKLKSAEAALVSLAKLAGVYPHRIDGSWGHLEDRTRLLLGITGTIDGSPVEHIPHSDVWRMTAWDVLDRVIGKMAESYQTYADVSFDVVVGGSPAKLTARFDLTFDVDDEVEVDDED